MIQQQIIYLFNRNIWDKGFIIIIYHVHHNKKY